MCVVSELREPRDDERRRVEFYYKRVSRALHSAPHYLALTTLRLIVAMIIDKARPEVRAQVLDDFCSELRADVRRGMQ